MKTQKVDATTVEVLANMYRAVVDEMAWVLLRSAHTTFVKETQDFSTGLVTPEGEMFAAPHTKGATPLVGISMAAGTRAVDDWAPGDVLITNDPYGTGGMVMHLNDLYLFRPIFHDGQLVCFAWSFIHCTDVGGAVAGSIDMKHTEVLQEGFRIRPMKLFSKGEFNGQLWDLFADNCRIPELNWGDVSALLSALQIGEKRVTELIAKHGETVVRESMYSTLDNTEELARRVLSEIPSGEFRFVEFFEDDYNSDLPVRLVLTMKVPGDGRVVLDFTGSDPQVRAAINLPSGGHKHHPFLCLALINLVSTHAEGMHLNAGLLRRIELVVPDHSVVNCDYPAAVGMRYSTACRVHDLVLGALNEAVPGMVPSGGSSHLVITYISTTELGPDGKVLVANSVQGGSGAGLGLDGESAVDFPAAFLRSVPVEVLESESPVTVHKLQLRTDTEGAGELRGGFGIEYALQVKHPSAVIVMRGKDRHRFTSFGVRGGGSGATADSYVVRGDESVTNIGKDSLFRPALDDVLSILTGGGGGNGSPLDRDPAAVAYDVADGLISVGRAENVYGVVLDAVGAVDLGATKAKRASLPRSHGFDFGEARTGWEQKYGAAAEHVEKWLPNLEPALRRPAQAKFYELLGSEPSYDDSSVQKLMTEVEDLFATALRGAGVVTPIIAREPRGTRRV